MDITLQSPAQEELPLVQESTVNDAFLAAIKDQYKSISFDGYTRVFHSHGHTLEEMFALRNDKLPRLVDVVIWPGDHSQVEKIVKVREGGWVVVVASSIALLHSTRSKRLLTSTMLSLSLLVAAPL